MALIRRADGTIVFGGVQVENLDGSIRNEESSRAGEDTAKFIADYTREHGHAPKIYDEGSVPGFAAEIQSAPASGTTPASRAAARAKGDVTLGYKDQGNAKIATAVSTGNDKVQVSADQVAALDAAGEEVPQEARDVLAGKQVEGYQQATQPQSEAQAQTDAQGNPVDATLGQNPVQVGGKFGTMQFGRVGDDVFEIMSDGSRRAVTAAEFNGKLKAQGLNLDVLPQLDPNSNVGDTPGGPGGSEKTTSQFVADYQGIVNELGLSDLKKTIADVTKEYEELQDELNDKVSDINEDPWLTEGTRVTRIRALQNRYEGKMGNLTAKLELFNTLYQQGVAEAKFLASGMQEDRNKMLDYAMKMAEAENDLGLEPGIIGEYQLAVRQGYEGSFRDYQNEDANRKRSIAGAGGFGGALSTAQMNSTINQIVGSFDSEPLVKNYGVALEGYNFIKSLSDKTTNPADDQALIYALAKALDPGSVVREGEYATAQKYSQSWINAYGKGVTQALAGTGFLSEQARTNIKKTIETKYNAAKASYDNLFEDYQDRIARVQGGGFNTIQDYSGAGTTPPQKLTPGTTFTQDNTIYLVGADGDPNNATPIGSAQ